MSNVNAIEEGIKIKIRFESGKGLLTIEDLYDLPIEDKREGKLDLNDLYKMYDKKKKSLNSSDGLIKKKSVTDELIQLRLDIIQLIYNYKKGLADFKLATKLRSEKRRKLKDHLENIEKEDMKGLSKADTLLALKDLDD
jgi:hypothetical protein